jgi:hypothetical protein
VWWRGEALEVCYAEGDGGKEARKRGRKKMGVRVLRGFVGWEGRERKEGKHELHVEEIIE